MLVNVKLDCGTVPPTGDFVWFLAAASAAQPLAVSSSALVTLHDGGRLWGVSLLPHAGMAQAANHSNPGGGCAVACGVSP